MFFTVNSLEQLLYGTPANRYLCFSMEHVCMEFYNSMVLGKNMKYFITNYDLAKYLTSLTIIIDFAEIFEILV